MSCPPFVKHNSQPSSTWALEWTAERRGRGGELAAPNPTVAGEPAKGMLIFSRQNPETDASRATERNIRLASPRESSCAHSTLTKVILANLWPAACFMFSRASVKLEENKMESIVDREPKTMPRSEHREGAVARTIEQQTAKLPSDTFLWAAIGSIAGSLTLMIMGHEKKANFVGQWAPTLLILGLYNKMVKLHGSEGR